MTDNNFFALFDLPVSFDIDKDALKKSLLTLQKQHHPDQADELSPPTQMAELINHAYDTLYHDDTRAAHLLSLAGVECDLNASIGDWDFLDEMLEFRMALDDANDESALNDILAAVNAKKSAHNADFASAYDGQNWQNAVISAQKIQFLEKLSLDVLHKISESLDKDNDDDLYV